MSKESILTEVSNNQTPSINEEQSSRGNETQSKVDNKKKIVRKLARNKENKSKPNPDSEGRSTKYKTGDVLKFVRVRFPGNAKSFPFVVEKRSFRYGQKVVAMSDRGMTVGYINSFPTIQPSINPCFP